MSGETRASISGWTIDTYASYQAALQASDEKYEGMRERLGNAIEALRDKLTISEDRRYSEVATEREKALKIKETADLAALGLAREIQTYKDEKANELREQISSERGLYVTKNEMSGIVDKIAAEIKPLGDAITGMRGTKTGLSDSRQLTTWALGVLMALTALYAFTQKPAAGPDPALAAILQELKTDRAAPAAPQVIYVPAPPGALLPTQPPQPAPR